MAFGIDFGTTNSEIVYEHGYLLRTSNGQPFPSLVALNKTTGEVKCGPDLRQQQLVLEEAGFDLIRGVKRYLDRPDHRWRAGGRLWSPREIATELLKAIRTFADDHSLSQHSLTEAAIAIPVGFSSGARKTLRRAAHEAGIEVTSFVSEPTAAYLFHRDGLPDCRHVAVFDWGGGTLDVSVIRIDGQNVLELATDGWNIAGDEIDNAIARWVHDSVKPADAPDFENAPAAERERLAIRCESAKTGLAGSPSRDIAMLSYLGKSLEVSIDREQLSEIAAPFVKQAMKVLDRALRAAGVPDDDLDRVVAVGGSSNLTAVQDALFDRFGAKFMPPEGSDAAWHVAQGASRLAQYPGCYRPMQRLCIVLGDEQGTALDLLQPDDRFDDKKKRQFHLGIVEDTKVAQLVFAESVSWEDRGRSAEYWPKIGFMAVPVQGFHRERVTLNTWLSSDLVFHAQAQGENMRDEDAAEWQYEGVRFAYELP